MGSQKFCYALGHYVGFLRLTFPNDEYAIPVFLQFGNVSAVAFSITVYLVAPEFDIGRRACAASARRMAVPKATMHKDNGVATRQYDIGLSREVRPMQSEPISQSMQELADNKFGGRVLARHPSHQIATLRFR